MLTDTHSLKELLEASAAADKLLNTEEDNYMAVIRQLALRLSRRGFTSATVRFDGSGDSGDLQGCDGFKDGEPTPVALTSEEECAVYQLISANVTCDWVNNEGGGGDVEFDLENGGVTIQSFYRTIQETACDDVEVPLINPAVKGGQA